MQYTFGKQISITKKSRWLAVELIAFGLGHASAQDSVILTYGQSNTLWNTLWSLNGSVTSDTATISVPATNGVEAFDYDLTVESVGDTDGEYLTKRGSGSFINLGGSNIPGTDDTDVEGLRFTVSTFSNTNVQFAGFQAISCGNVGSSELSIRIAGLEQFRLPSPSKITITEPGQGSSLTNLGLSLTFEAVVDISGDDGLDFRNLQLRFSIADGPPDVVPPAAPTGLTASNISSVILLDWNDNTEPDLAHYRVYRRSGAEAYTMVDVTSDSSYMDSSALSNGVLYTYKVTARDTVFNESDDSNEASATGAEDTTPPAPPTGFTATPTNGIVMLDWDDNSESDLLSYNLCRATDASAYRIVQSGIVSSTFTNAGLFNARRYYYYVSAMDYGGNESSPSAEESAIPMVSGTEDLNKLSGTHFEDYAAWPDVAALVEDKTLDTDGDGESDLLEFKLGSDLTNATSRSGETMQIGVSGGKVNFKYHERISSPGVHAGLAISTNLQTWTTNQAIVTEMGRTLLPDGITEEVEVAINDPALNGADAVFARLWIDDALYIPRFAVLPEGTTTGTVSMTAGEGSFDPRTVEYNFEAVTPGGHSSGWQRNRLYIDSGLEPGSNYTYHVMLRQTETNGTPVVDSETGWSRSASASTPASGVRPNIIVFMADDLGWECFDIYGESDHNTPYISRMAAEGIKFANFHSQPLCTPSRVQIMSGQYNHRNYTTFGNYVPDKSFATFFRQAGYKTCISGKWQLDYRDRTASYVPRRPHALGFDEWLLWNVDQQGSRYWNPVLVTTTPSNGFNYVTTTEEDYGPDLVNEFMNNFATAAADNGDPFFIYCPLIDPHSPFVIPPDGMGSNTIEHQAMVEYLDKLVGQTLEMIRNHPNMANNTLVFITGDNGTNKGITTQFNGASYAGGKGGTFDPGTHVPAVAWGMKNMVTNTVCDDLVDLTDILATICDVAGVPIDQDYIIDGRSFRSKLLGESRDPRRWVYGWYTNKDGVLQHAWARNKHYKLYETGLPGSRSGNFYDVINDEREVSPLPPPPAGSRLEALKAEFQAVLDRMDADSDPGNN